MEFALIISMKRRDKDCCTYPAEGVIRRISMLGGGEVLRNRVKCLLAEKKRPSAAWLQAANPITAEIMAKAGSDILMVDMEHRFGRIMDLIGQLQAVFHYDVMPFARMLWNDFATIRQILDADVSGILVPYVNNTEEAARVVSACKYPLGGTRDIAPSPRAGGYGMNQRDYLDYTSEELDVLVVVETKTTVGHIKEIVKINGLGGVFIGSMDLTTSFGRFCNPKGEEVQEAIRKVETAVLGFDRSPTTVAGSSEEAEKLCEKGYSMMIMMLDTTTLGRAALNWVEQFKEMYPQR